LGRGGLPGQQPTEIGHLLMDILTVFGTYYNSPVQRSFTIPGKRFDPAYIEQIGKNAYLKEIADVCSSHKKHISISSLPRICR
jgi:hypothetical protein